MHGGMAEGGPGGEQPSRLPLLQLQGGGAAECMAAWRRGAAIGPPAPVTGGGGGAASQERRHLWEGWALWVAQLRGEGSGALVAGNVLYLCRSLA